MSISLLANCLRFLSIDAVEKAQSGHPGMPLGMADIAAVLWTRHLKHNPKNPVWFNRDRFVLSNGHGSMLLYALLHLTGYPLTLQDLKDFRQLNSKTPGHPEHETPGVETTTGPLGQGLANAVGMAIAEKNLNATFNKANLPLVDHYTYAFVGDGCLMEGLSHEACSLAGVLGLNKLIVFYDDNGISIDGQVGTWFADDTAARFQAYNWQVLGPIDGHDAEAIDAAIHLARKELHRPTLIICKTIIGYGSLAAGSEKTHGAPLGAADCAQLRHKFNWPYPEFVIPEELYATWNHVDVGVVEEDNWLTLCADYQRLFPAEYHVFLRRINGDLPDEWAEKVANLQDLCRLSAASMATRQASQKCLDVFAEFMPELLGGSADLTGSNNTNSKFSQVLTKVTPTGNYVHYGVRELAMAAIMNGIALHGGFIPYGGTFLVFSDYARSAMRLSALMKQRVIYVLTHDSIGLGEDGPTHQPVEHAAMLRMTPGLWVWRPADWLETAIAWEIALLQHNAPSCLLLSRQSLPALIHKVENTVNIARGGYILQECAGTPDVILIATGSEVSLALESATKLQEFNLAVRVVSMPCPQLFLVQDLMYQHQVLPPEIRQRVVIEAGVSDYWFRFVGLDGLIIGLDRFGVSAPIKDAYRELGFTVERVLYRILDFLGYVKDVF